MSEKNPGGRPSAYDPKYCQEIIEWFRSFKEDEKACPLFEEFADVVDVSMATLHRWRDAHPEFRDAWSQAKAIQYSIMVQRGLTGKFNSNFTYRAMCNMHRWSDKQESQVEQNNTFSFSYPNPKEQSDE